MSDSINSDGRCWASWPDPTGWISIWFAEREVNCNKLANHVDGVHEAHDAHGRLLARWEEGDVPPAWRTDNRILATTRGVRP